MDKLARGLLWIKQLVISLSNYLLKHPEALPLVIPFFFQKLKYLPMFFYRNTATEHFSNEYSDLIEETVKLYENHKNFSLEKASLSKLSKLFKSPYQFLYFLVRKYQPEIIVETGVAAGKSSGLILRAIKDNQDNLPKGKKTGKLYSIDLPFQWYVYSSSTLHLDSLPAGKLPGYLIPENLKKNWQLIIGDTYEQLPRLLKKLGAVDMFFHDSEHTFKTMMFEYNQAWPRLSKKGILVSDDIDFTTAFADFAKQKKVSKTIFKQLGIIFKSNKL